MNAMKNWEVWLPKGFMGTIRIWAGKLGMVLKMYRRLSVKD